MNFAACDIGNLCFNLFFADRSHTLGRVNPRETEKKVELAWHVIWVSDTVNWQVSHCFCKHLTALGFLLGSLQLQQERLTLEISVSPTLGDVNLELILHRSS